MRAPPVWFEALTPLLFVERAGIVHKDRIAVVDGAQRFSYGQFLNRCRLFASALEASGLQAHDRVGFLALNTEPLLLSHFAVPMAGGVVVAINTRLSPSEVAHIVQHSGARWLFYSPELTQAVTEISGSCQVIPLDGAFEAFLSSGSSAQIDWKVLDECEPIAIDYTSGTTGKPHGVTYHHRGAYLNALGMVIENRLTTDSRLLWTLPMFHCNGWSHTWAAVAAGSTSVCLPRVDPESAWRLMDCEAITHFLGSPTVLSSIAHHPNAHVLAAAARACTGGAAPTVGLYGALASLNIELVHLYGLTETYGPLTINAPSPHAATLSGESPGLIQRQGFPHIAASHVRVVDKSSRDVPADGRTRGEVVVAGNTTMKGYYRDPGATRSAFRGGWFHTGDVAVVHADGAIEICDRSKDVIISGGENVSSLEVEAVVDEYPGVLECAVVGVPDAHWGEVPMAYITVSPGMRVDPEALKTHLRSRLAHFKCPKYFEFGPLPKTSTGKVQKYLLRQLGLAHGLSEKGE